MSQNYFSTELIVDYNVFRGSEFADLAYELEASNGTMHRVGRDEDTENLFEYLETKYPEIDFGDSIIVEFFW